VFGDTWDYGERVIVGPLVIRGVTVTAILGQIVGELAYSAMPRAQVADSDSDDLRRTVWTQRRVQCRELVHHVLLTQARVPG
jgi:hypothetical protein